eukprot:4622485-Pleurochrysis_carterae.AAC.1
MVRSERMARAASRRAQHTDPYVAYLCCVRSSVYICCPRSRGRALLALITRTSKARLPAPRSSEIPGTERALHASGRTLREQRSRELKNE